MIMVMFLLDKVLSIACCLSNNILKTRICPCSAGQQSGFSFSKAGTFGSQGGSEGSAWPHLLLLNAGGAFCGRALPRLIDVHK